jgi:hypothetical protein
MQFGQVFGIWDYEWIMANVPRSVITTWTVKWMIRPPDAANTLALMQGEFERPEWLEDMIDEQVEKDRKAAPKKKHGMSMRAIRRALTRKAKTFLGWIWP